MNSARSRGFTVVELIVVIVVIATLAVVSIVAYGAVQREARDTERKTDIAAIRRNLEVFYNKNSYYPGTTQLKSSTDTSWVSTNLPDLKSQDLLAPGALSTDHDSIVTNTTPAIGEYGYYPQQANASLCTTGSTGAPCVRYSLTWKQETNDQSVVEVKSEVYPTVP